MLSRRSFIATSALGAFATTVRAKERPAGLVRAARPKPPYRVWFAPRQFERDADLYRHMTIDAGGWLDPQLAHLCGKTALDWVYGLNHPDATGPAYWRDACSQAGRSFPRKEPKPGFLSAGIALDEWVPAKQPQNEAWLLEGLRAGRRANPEVFIAIWSTDPTPSLFDLAHDGTADLLIIEGYTHSVERGLSLKDWDSALRRTDLFAKGGVLSKTIFSFGHITAEKSFRGEHLQGAWLREKAEELKRRYPEMPGIAFYHHPCPDTPEQRELVRFCDRLSAQFWPDPA